MRSIATTVYEFSTQILMRSDGKLLVKAFNKKKYIQNSEEKIELFTHSGTLPYGYLGIKYSHLWTINEQRQSNMESIC